MTAHPPIGERLTPGQAAARGESWRAAGRRVEVVDARKMMLMVVVRRDDAGNAVLQAEAPNCTRREAAHALRIAADQFDAAADKAGDPPVKAPLTTTGRPATGRPLGRPE